MSQENVEIVRSVYEAMARGDWDGAFENADPEITFTNKAGPTAGTRRGREEIVAFLEDFSASFQSAVWEPEEFFDRGDKVVVFVALRSRLREGGVELVIQNGHLWTLRDGTAYSVEGFPKREDALEAAGISR